MGLASQQLGLSRSMSHELDYFPAIAGKLPPALRGTLYRNGPGRFDHGGLRKRHLLDGDGMIQAFTFGADGRVRYRNRFVRTHKFQLEQQAGRFVLPTWSTLARGGLFKNMGHRIQSQAGVTVFHKHDGLFAFDEVGLPWKVDPDSLETVGEQHLGPESQTLDFKAHTKTDPYTGRWALLSFEYGRRNYVHLVEHGADMRLLSHQRFAVPRSVYVHDWFLSEHYALVLLHPAMFSPLRYLSGAYSYMDSVRWRPDEGNLLMVIDRQSDRPPLFLDAPARFMWHSLNSYEENGRIIADFVSYSAPDHFLGKNAALRTVMEGREGLQQHSGLLTRYIVDPVAGKLTETMLSPRNCEFPMVDMRCATRKHQVGYFTTAPRPTVFHQGLARIDVDSGAEQVADLGEGTHLGEPIFVPEPGAGPDQGWLLAVGLDGQQGNSFLGVFRAQNLSDGPVARVLLSHPTPLSFHGDWHSPSKPAQ